ncbi:MAG: 16S rRNA (adenine(1518)-N(6)/adenine(1519)-N(6))-dimethyltransferase RsmA [Thermoguttaceae bacterium]|jgi:16S rRNA (adenine1518-N6/adenine1519-N6)-dimethyltransferase
MAEGSSNNQTRTYLMQRFETLGIHPRKKLGQNFLIDLNLLRLLHESAQLDKNDVVLEVGTGTGSLTGAMAQEAGVVVTVEVDSIMHEMAKQEHWDKDNIRFLFADILENKNRLNCHVLDVIREELAKSPDRRFKLCANLPYQIATPLMSNLLLTDVPPHSMTVTIQKEVGERMVAKPGKKDYGAFAVWMQAQCDCKILRIMPPSVFWPRPKVDSAIVQAVYNQKKRDRIKDLKFFHEFVRAIFFHRRKYLRSVLCSAMKNRLEKKTVDQVLAEMKLNGEIRAETLPVKTILALSEKFRVLLPEDRQYLLSS